MESLADFLGVHEAREGEVRKEPTEKSPVRSMSRREYARQILSSPEYRQMFFDRIRLGEMPPGLEILLHYYAYGKPTEHLEVRDKSNPLEGLSIEQLEERALMLANRARELRKMQEPSVSSEESVH